MSPVGSHVIKLAEGLHVPRLERANYQKWLVLIEAALRHFNLWESHIIAKPPSKPDQPYLINNAKAYSMISATLSKDNEKLAEDLNGIPLSAHLSFAAIKKHHETGNMSAKLELEDELDLIVYDTQVGVKQLYDEMFDIRKLLSQIGVKWSDEDYVRKLLRKLLKGSSHWGNMRTRFDSFTKSNYATADIRTMLAYEEQQLITVMLLPSLDNAEVASPANLHTWHRRLGHIGKKAILDLAKTVNGMDILPSNSPPRICEACIEGQAHKKPFPVPNHRAYDWSVTTTLSKPRTAHPIIDNDSDDEMPLFYPIFTTTTTPIPSPELIEDDDISTTPTRTQMSPARDATPVTETQQEEDLGNSSQTPTIIATSEYNDGTYPTIHQSRPNPEDSNQASQIIRSGGVTTKDPFESSSPLGFNPSRLPNPLRPYKGYTYEEITDEEPESHSSPPTGRGTSRNKQILSSLNEKDLKNNTRALTAIETVEDKAELSTYSPLYKNPHSFPETRALYKRVDDAIIKFTNSRNQHYWL
ncbi:hypothetical protein BATDEDRAFT_26426 [Batrachochytrium dendrobatidis JAM81]|uniref:GAG-pre-integrase domain-containing protein n=1 Tax=Batrachochytrium dendrobatidis (strain JAM81 / FGSC 10211) TaxID=684364 RepID=F4P8D5_BATDJ|nr:uncharacterized protein BATDEDRAFT_26426 [Batrachochytrium dendrobatidis JAM81]EGF78415.1 hypothetical protein BATDEDRAFT_26426 [Batrachochytrium dendrobatidis JAM81]|eukprot:XP_006680665.1 hypothetical protein BATDEDRAFT_26426 [Batrachochytrium dendrobatidis JAM81]